MRTSPFFEVCGYKVISERMHEPLPRSQAIVEISFGGRCRRRSSMGCGPVHALDNALRSCLGEEFAEVGNVKLLDYRVGIVEAAEGTGAKVKVVVEATDGSETWQSSCVSDNIIDASFEALCEMAVNCISRARGTGRYAAVASSA
jgi:2-isopropylmalate synthase